jgi:phage-related protein (TIGR01555 family)
MTLLERITGLFSRGDAVPAPALDSTALVLRQDTAPVVHVRQDSTINPLTGFGDPLRDKGSAGRPNIFERGLTQAELLSLYTYGGLARRMVDLLPDRAIRKGWSAPDIPTEEEERLQLYDRFAEAWRMGDLWGGALLLMVTQDELPAQYRGPGQEWMWLQQPLDLRRIGRLHALQVYDAREAAPFVYDSDIRSPNYRQPLLWEILDRGLNRTVRVHHSRVLWFRGARRPPSEVGQARWGGGMMPDDSVLQAVWAEVRRLTETAQGGAILAAEIREKVLKVADLPSKLTGDEGEKFKARMSITQKLLSALNVLVIGKNDEYISRSNPATGFKDLSEGAWDMLAGARGWPKVVLRGDAPSGLNTDGASAWQALHQLVSDQQERKRSLLNRLYSVMYAAQDGPTRGKAPKRWAITFHPLDEPPQKELAEVRERIARVDQIYVQLGVYGAEVVAEKRLGPDGFVLDMPDVPVPDPDAQAEKAIERAVRMQEALEGRGGTPRGGGGDRGAGGDPDEGREDDLHHDAGGDGTVVVVPAAEPPPALLASVEEAIGQRLRRPSNPAHVTVIYLGEGLSSDEVAEVVRTVDAQARDTMTSTLRQPVMRAFGPGLDGTPVVVEFEDAWTLGGLNERLLRATAHLITAKQWPRFRAHLTLGYAEQPLSSEALRKLSELQVEELAVAVVVLEVRNADEVVATVQIGG